MKASQALDAGSIPATRSTKVNKIFLILVFGTIIFLTGCAPGRYYTGVPSQGVPRGNSGVPALGFAKNFSWPMHGNLAVPFGVEEGLVPLKGIVIESVSDDEVRSAQDGRVVLVDPDLKGYGRTIIVEHSSEFSTVYARNSEILVLPGQGVRQGDLIARAGKKNGSSHFRMYFEIRRNLKAEDPARYLKKI